ncbi:MAG: rod shape-determining protein RodA [Candidatus Edwardsbacteria bacterium]
MNWRDFDFFLLSATVILCLIGLVAVYSATQTPNLVALELFQKHFFWLVIGLFVLSILVAVPYRIFEAYAYPLYGISLGLLILVLFIPSSAGAHRWFKLGLFNFQPSEIAKITTIFALAKYLSQKEMRLPDLREFFTPILLMGLPFALVLIEPDLGTSLGFPFIFFVLLYWRGASIYYLFFLLSPVLSVIFSVTLPSWAIFAIILIVLFIVTRIRLTDLLILSSINVGLGILSPVVWHSLKEYQKKRLFVFLNPNLDPKGAGWHILQSKIAIGSGGLLGKGFLQGTQKRLAFLPEQHTDFIFSTFGEEFGFLGATILLGLYFFLLYRAVRIARQTRNSFASLVVIGIAAILFFHIFLNMGMTVGFLPITGLPLPFLSYGGSALISMMGMVGIVLNIGLRRYEY